jgi:predicted secreted hydrolase
MRTDLRALGALALGFFLPLSLCFAQFQPALPGYRFGFPRDYFNHPDYQTEWWYYTGNLQSLDGHKFGFELTFFRQGVSRDPKQSSAWSLRDIYFAHFALSDLTGKKFFHTERTNRAGPGIAGVSPSPQKIWNGNWSVAWAEGGERLTAFADSFALSLALYSQKPPVIHGDNGVSQKSAGPGRGSHYFSETRLSSSGSLTFENRKYSVTGLAWMDHEFFTHQLEANQMGWDWFSIQLDDHTELMLFQIRRKDGSIDPFSAGTFVDAQGRAIHLRASDFQLSPAPDASAAETWTSPSTHARYPVRWQIHVARLNLTLLVTTPLPSQELATRSSFVPSYWEGAILLQGKKNSAAVAGSGYLEMTGYDRPASVGEF